ncbi:MAG: thioredoxin family protein [Candidatus Nanopelagicales bacterium]
MDVQLLYFDDCPNWTLADERLRHALRLLGRTDVSLTYRRIETEEEAEAVGFHGSPTILVDDRDPFDSAGAGGALCCRVYRTPAGPAGTPTVQQLVGALSY